MIKNIRKIRIIGGNLRSRKITFTTTFPTLRPTSNRIRETLFNWLSVVELNFKNAHCLDCYAGTGALSIEALSRHAASATLLELNKSVVTQIQNNLLILGIKNGHVIHSNTLKWLSTYKKKFNLIFIDPPFNSQLINSTILLLEENSWLMEPSWIYIETHVKNCNLKIPSNWHFYRSGIAGQAYYCLYKRHCK
ncbi:MAG: 16S rRNA (guanine(966)-N(2))-methyltransferase RsmD [Candidatus Dasytiphilus stammeri]